MAKNRMTPPTLRQARKYVEKYPKFFEAQSYQGLQIFSYKRLTHLLFIDDIAKQLRGITYSEENGKVVLWPFHKFFNLGERDLPIPKFFSVGFEKYDGSMIQARWYNDKVILATRALLNPESSAQIQQAMRYLQEHDFSDILREKGQWTFIFELVGPENNHVINYDDTRLVLLAARHVVYGHYMPWDTLRNLGFEHIAEPLLRNISIEGVREWQAKAKGIEGVVLHTPDGEIWKAKTDWYMKTRTDIENYKQDLPLWGVTLYYMWQNTIDDVMSWNRKTMDADTFSQTQRIYDIVSILVYLVNGIHNGWTDCESLKASGIPQYWADNIRKIMNYASEFVSAGEVPKHTLYFLIPSRQIEKIDRDDTELLMVYAPIAQVFGHGTGLLRHSEQLLSWWKNYNDESTVSDSCVAKE